MSTIRPGSRVHLGEALALLRELPDASVDGLITDPPYSSGGFTRGDRMADPAQKYEQSGNLVERVSFTGDNRDARSWAYWMALWLSECVRIVKPGGYAMVFSDWRQLPLATDAFQAGGFVWRGLISWDKGLGSRGPHTGYFRHQCEYIVWGSNGPLAPAAHGGPWPGSFSIPIDRSDKHHMTGKPTALMRELVRVIPPGGVVLDPFAGSGTTGVACELDGRRFIGFEVGEFYAGVANERIAAAKDSLDFAAHTQKQAALFAGVSHASLSGSQPIDPRSGDQSRP